MVDTVNTLAWTAIVTSAISLAIALIAIYRNRK